MIINVKRARIHANGPAFDIAPLLALCQPFLALPVL